MTISGFEKDEATSKCLGQSWFVQLHVEIYEQP
jgi:hypothetical protein